MKKRSNAAPAVARPPKAPGIGDGGSLTDTDRWVRQAKKPGTRAPGHPEAGSDPRDNMHRTNRKGEAVDRVNSWVRSDVAKRLRVYCAEADADQGDVVTDALVMFFEANRAR
jgi:hypothetical protein